MKIRTSELRKSLKDKGLDAADVEVLVKAKVDKGEAEEDEAPASAFDIDASDIDAFAESFAKSRQTALAGTGSAALSKAADGEPGDLLQLLETFAAAQDETLARIDDNHTILGEGLVAVGKTAQGLVKAVGQLGGFMREAKSLLTEVRDRLGEPVPPRAVDAGEGTGGAGGGGGGGGSSEPGTLAKSLRAVKEAAVAEMGLLTTDPKRREVLYQAVRRLDEGEQPEQVAKTYKISV